MSESESASGGTAAPEEGQTVLLRHKIWEVMAVSSIGRAKEETLHKVGLECIGDDSLGREIDVIWEREIAPIVFERISLPTLDGIDSPELFNAFLNALKWSASSLAEGSALHAPFRSGVQIEDFQHEPLLKAQEMPRVRLLIADDVGLGKTIEAGLIVQDLIHSHRASSILIVCPAHLRTKWVDEMADKFGLEFRIIDGDTVKEMRREFGPMINPWASFPRLVTSIDYMKTERPLARFEELALRRKEESTARRSWDLLILDEAHNAAPAGRKRYIRDSDRTKLLRTIADHFEHRLFLTATPHNGYRPSFTGLLELLDELRFSRGADLDQEQLEAVRVRRLKEHIRKPDGSPFFVPRVVLPRSEEHDPELYVDLQDDERELFDLLDRYRESRQANVTRRSERALQFTLTILKKRALSSPLAIRESLIVHASTVGADEDVDVGETLFRTLEQKDEEDWSDDDERDQARDEATEAASRLCERLSDEESSWLTRMSEIARAYADEDGYRPDSKAQALIRWIETNLKEGDGWGDERLMIFTEYRHTLEYLRGVLDEAGMGDRVLEIYGGLPASSSDSVMGREEVNAIFQTPPDRHPARILIATDAASEGADFQLYCRYLFHYDIPWNPVRLEQRNGRVDRYGQEREVRIHHLVLKGQQDSEFLSKIVEKIETIRTDLGSVSKLISDSIRAKALGEKVDLKKIDEDERRAVARGELDTDSYGSEEAKKMSALIEKARAELGIDDEALLDFLQRALELEGLENAIQVNDDGSFLVLEVPRSWTECKRFVSGEDRERPLTLDRRRALREHDLDIIHLNHPLIQRALRAFRAQMWSAATLGLEGLKRASVEISAELDRPVLVAWGRLLLLGSERNRLHEGLVRIGARVGDDGLEEITEDEIQSLIKGELTPFTGDIRSLEQKIGAHHDVLEELLEKAGAARCGALEGALKERGEQAARHARALATEQMKALRKAIKDWEREKADPQLALNLEEDKQLETDVALLKAKLASLEEDREVESRRLKHLYRVADQRVYPVAFQVLLPEGLA
jgi:SNF2 family DNA or RNA helicase